MKAPLSGKQQREDLKFLFDELRKTVAQRKEQRRKDQTHNQKMKQSDEKHLQKMDVPPMMGKPMNPEAGPSDKIPALLTAGEAVIPKKAAQNPKNKPLIKAMVGEGRSDINLSVPPKGFSQGATHVQGYADGDTDVQWEQPEVPMPIAQDFVTTYDPNAVAPVYEVPAPVAAVPTQVPVQGDNQFIARAESGSNPNIGYHYADGKTSAYGTYGITAGTYKDIQKADSYFKDKPITELSVEEQTKANNVLTGLNTTRLAKNDIEPTPANLRLSHFLGAEGAAEYLKTGKLNDEAIKANGGYEKTKAIADARLAGPASQNRSMAERAVGVLTGSSEANAATPEEANAKNRSMLEGTKFNKPVGGDFVSGIKESISKIIPKANDVSGIKAWGQGAPVVKPTPVPPSEVNTTPSITVAPPPVVEYKPPTAPQGAYAQQDKYLGDIPKVGGTEQQQIIRNQNSVFNEPEKVKGSIEKYGDSIASTIGGVWDTIKDPKELGNFITSFVKDTLGFNGQDAARFGLLVAGSRALGYNTTQAVRYAGNYTLQASDKRATATALSKSQMEQLGVKEAGDLKKTMIGKGYTQNSKGEWVFKPVQGVPQPYTVDTGKYRGQELTLYEFTDARGNKNLADANGKTIEQYKQELGQPIVKMQDYHRPEHQAAKRVEFASALGKDIDSMKTEKLNDKTIKGIASSSWASLPHASVMSNQLVDTSEKYGLNMAYSTDQRIASTAIRQAAEDAVSAAKGSDVSVHDVSYQFEKQMLVKGIGPTATLYKNSSNKEVQASDIVNNFKQVEAKFNGDRKQTINMFTSWANDFRQSKGLQEKWEPTATKSGFMRYVENELKQMK